MPRHSQSRNGQDSPPVSFNHDWRRRDKCQKVWHSGDWLRSAYFTIRRHRAK